MYSAYPPSNEIPVASNSTWQAKKSPRRHGSQCPQCEACHPTPTRCPDFQSGTSGPTASITPITSWPGILGYWIPGQSPSLTIESLCQTPHASTFTRTKPDLGSGISRSTTSNGHFAFGICTARIFLAMRSSIVLLSRKRKICSDRVTAEFVNQIDYDYGREHGHEIQNGHASGWRARSSTRSGYLAHGREYTSPQG